MKQVKWTVGLVWALLSCMGMAEEVLAAWERGMQFSRPTQVCKGISAESAWGVFDGTALWSTEWQRWSNDGIFGASTGGAQLSQGAFQLASSNTGTSRSYLRFYLQNKGKSAIQLTQFSFDIWSAYHSVDGFTVQCRSGNALKAEEFNGTLLTTGPVEIPRRNALPNEGGDDYDDFDINLTQLPKAVLEPGEEITFEIEFLSTGNGGRFYVDNVAVLGYSMTLISFNLTGPVAVGPFRDLEVKENKGVFVDEQIGGI
jgi:hypothetical protein